MAKREAGQEIASRADRDQAWGAVLAKVVAHEGLSLEEKAAAIALVIAEQDGLDAGETVADLRKVIDRGLAGLKDKGQIEQIPGGGYRLKRGKPSRTPMAVDSERLVKPDMEADTQAPPEVA